MRVSYREKFFGPEEHSSVTNNHRYVELEQLNSSQYQVALQQAYIYGVKGTQIFTIYIGPAS